MARDYKLGFQHGIKWAIEWLHEEARKMNDPKAKGVLNSAGFHLGTHKRGIEPIPTEDEPTERARRPYDDAASEMWKLTKTDWHVRVTHTLTEPTCAIVDLRPDDEAFPKQRGYIGTGDLNESVRLACEKHLIALREHCARSAAEKP